jgi:hypothetical protein
LLFWGWCVGRSVRHGFPLAPGLAGLAALVWLGWLRHEDAKVRRRARVGLVGLLAVWVAVKVVFVEAVVPARTEGRAARAKAEQLAALVPAGETLYLARLKDEGLTFYYGRPVRRLPSFEQLPSSPRPLFCIVTHSEWQAWGPAPPAEVVLRTADSQGDPIVLVRVRADR